MCVRADVCVLGGGGGGGGGRVHVSVHLNLCC